MFCPHVLLRHNCRNRDASTTAMRWITTLLTLSAMLAGINLASAQAGPREAFYRCKDGTGQTQYSNSLAPWLPGPRHRGVERRGTSHSHHRRRRQRAARLRTGSHGERRTPGSERLAQRDRMLIETYLSVADIERLRDQRLEQLVSQYRMTEQSIKNMRERQARLEATDRTLQALQRQVECATVARPPGRRNGQYGERLRVYAESLAKNKQEQAEVKSFFDSRHRRFKELKGIK